MTNETDPLWVEIISLQVAKDLRNETVRHGIKRIERSTLTSENTIMLKVYTIETAGDLRTTTNLITFGHEKVQVGTRQH